VQRPLVQVGEPVDVRLRLGNRIPYILIGPEQTLEYVSERSERLTAR
jgi:hypothetical protein